MSKAFTKDEGEGSEPVDIDVDLLGSLPPGTKNYMTKAGYERLQKEIAGWIEKRHSPGDQQGRADRKIKILQRTLDLAEPINPTDLSGDRVLFGATVTTTDEHDRERTYQIVGITETDAAHGKISWLSPVGKALLQSSVGDSVVIHTPHGDEHIEIIKIQFI